MRRVILSLAVAAVICTGLTAAIPAPAQAQWGGSYYDRDDCRQRAWREHRWHEWMWRRHMSHEWHEHHYG